MFMLGSHWACYPTSHGAQGIKACSAKRGKQLGRTNCINRTNKMVTGPLTSQRVPPEFSLASWPNTRRSWVPETSHYRKKLPSHLLHFLQQAAKAFQTMQIHSLLTKAYLSPIISIIFLSSFLLC